MTPRRSNVMGQQCCLGPGSIVCAFGQRDPECSMGSIASSELAHQAVGDRLALPPDSLQYWLRATSRCDPQHVAESCTVSLRSLPASVCSVSVRLLTRPDLSDTAYVCRCSGKFDASTGSWTLVVQHLCVNEKPVHSCWAASYAPVARSFRIA